MLSLNFGPFSGIDSFSVSNLERREEGALIIYPSFMPSVRPSVRPSRCSAASSCRPLPVAASPSLACSASHVSFVRGARGGEGGRQSGRAAHSSSLRFPDLVTFPLTLSLPGFVSSSQQHVLILSNNIYWYDIKILLRVFF